MLLEGESGCIIRGSSPQTHGCPTDDPAGGSAKAIDVPSADRTNASRLQTDVALTDAFAEKFDAARRFALHWEKDCEWWYLQREDHDLAAKLLRREPVEFEPFRLEVSEIANGDDTAVVFHLRLFFLDMMAPMESRIVPDFAELPEPQYRLFRCRPLVAVPVSLHDSLRRSETLAAGGSLSKRLECRRAGLARGIRPRPQYGSLCRSAARRSTGRTLFRVTPATSRTDCQSNPSGVCMTDTIRKLATSSMRGDEA